MHLHIFSILIRSDDFYKKSFLIILFSETRGIIKYIYIFFQKIKYSDRQGLIDTIIDINRRIKMSYRSHWSEIAQIKILKFGQEGRSSDISSNKHVHYGAFCESLLEILIL